MLEKKCPKCHKIKSPSEFSKDSSRKDGLMCYCKQCMSLSGSRWWRNGKLYPPSNISEKRCSRCKNTKPISLFRLNKHITDGYCSWCVDCERKTQSDFRNNKSDNVKGFKMKTRYGITKETYNEMLKSQNGVCAICGKPETKKDHNGNIQPLSIDHSHISGDVRSLLCNACNVGLGRFHDSPDLLIRAAEYLQKFVKEQK